MMTSMIEKHYIRPVSDEDGEHLGCIYGNGFSPGDREVFFDLETEAEERASTNATGLITYSEEGDNPWTVINEIQVPTQHDKDQLLIALKYLHDCYIDTDFLAVNTLVHMYQCPDKIKVTS
jgi:hypothetical protein